jgi:hypothetical protein
VKITKVIALIAIVSLVAIAFYSCSVVMQSVNSGSGQNEALKATDAFVQALQQGNLAAVRSLITNPAQAEHLVQRWRKFVKQTGDLRSMKLSTMRFFPAEVGVDVGEKISVEGSRIELSYRAEFENAEFDLYFVLVNRVDGIKVKEFKAIYTLSK